jgi:DNA-binding MarR family transcriptional regulator
MPRAEPTDDRSQPARKQLRSDPIALAARNWRRAGWATSADGMAAVTSVMRAQQLLLAQVEEVLRPVGLTFARYEVLMLLTLSRSGELPLGVVGSRLQVHPASVTGLVKRLEQNRLVARRVDPDDARARRVRVTDRGRRAAHDATERLNAAVFSAGWIASDGGRDLFRVLSELRAAYGDFEGEA